DPDSRANEPRRRKTALDLELVVSVCGSLLALGAGIFIMAYSFPNQMHSALSYRVICTVFPALLASIGYASHQRWASTKLAAMYMLFCMASIWILPLFPAEPKLGH